MVRGLEAVLIGSENSQALADFYKDKVGLKVTEEMEVGENNEKGFAIEFGSGSNLYVLEHSKVKGKNTNPDRILLNLEVDDIEEEFKKAKNAGVKVVQEVYHVEGYGLIATFEDIDGNYFQFVQIRANK